MPLKIPFLILNHSQIFSNEIVLHNGLDILEPLQIIENKNGLIEVVVLVPPASVTHQDGPSEQIPSKEVRFDSPDHMESFDESEEELSLAAHLWFDCWAQTFLTFYINPNLLPRLQVLYYRLIRSHPRTSQCSACLVTQFIL